MIAIGKWFDRKFRFDFPLSIYSPMLERLRGTPVRLEEKAGHLPEKALAARDSSSWSIQEHAGHLLDLESLHALRVQEFIRGVHVLSAADLNNGKTRSANHNSKSIGSILEAFRTQRSHMVSVLEEIDESVVSRAAMHPRLMQMMNVLDLCYFIAEHDDHHLAKIESMARHFHTSE